MLSMKKKRKTTNPQSEKSDIYLQEDEDFQKTRSQNQSIGDRIPVFAIVFSSDIRNEILLHTSRY